MNLVKDEIYSIENGKWIVKNDESLFEIYWNNWQDIDDNSNIQERFGGCFDIEVASNEQKAHYNACVKAGKYVDCPEEISEDLSLIHI